MAIQDEFLDRTKELIEMSSEELRFDNFQQAVVAKFLPDGGYLLLVPQLMNRWLVSQSKQGDMTGWSEGWYFDNFLMAAVAILSLLNGEKPVGWTRHNYINEAHENVAEYPA